MPDEEVDLTVDPGAPDPDAEPGENEPDEHGESIHPADGIGTPIEPPQPSNLETRVKTPADAEPPPPVPDALTHPEPLPEPPKPPSIAELTEEATIPVHECHLPLRFIQNAAVMRDYVNKNEHRLNKPRRKLDVSKAPIKAGYPIFAKAMQAHGHYPLTEHWYAAALILVTMGVPIDEEPKADTDAILDQLAQ
jgi:hypothetical protein